MKSKKKIIKRKKKQKRYTDKEIEIILFMSNLLIGFDGNSRPLKGWKSLLLNAWRMTRSAFNSIFNRCINCGLEYRRKERSDKGESIFVSESRRNQTVTALNEYKKQRGQEFRDFPDKMC